MADSLSPKPGEKWHPTTNKSTMLRHVVAIVEASPEPLILMELGQFEPSRHWLLLSEWQNWAIENKIILFGK